MAVESNENPTTCSVEHTCTLYVKDKFGISDQAYHELAMVNKDLPRMYALKMEAKELDSESQIWSTPGEAIGVQQSLRVRLKRRLHVLMQNDPSILVDPHIKVKLTGDGTRLSRSMHTIVIAFTIFRFTIWKSCCSNL